MNKNFLPHQLRVIDEAADLDEKLRKLQAFIDGALFVKLDERERSLLQLQHNIMKGYHEVLSMRIAGFQETCPTPVETIVKDFVEKHRISCPETIHQTDRVIENAYGLIEDLCDEVGYYKYPEEQG